jgi:hypothetical protein
MHYFTIDRFYPKAAQLRAVFDQKFEDPLATRADRFVWDYWHVEGEYTNLRTPAFHYFPKKIYEPFHRFLVEYGREHLGCHDVSPPWLSCYIEGCQQYPHQDLPHGPLAFVFSLTNWQTREFKGGETFIVKPRTLIEPKFNRLALFNPALVHGVKEVRGTLDPRAGRLVIHGWFVNPRAFWKGPFTAEEVQASLDQGLARVLQMGFQLGPGLLTTRLKISKAGEVEKITILVNTLLVTPEREVRAFLKALKSLQFPKKSRSSELTLPLITS